jgi:hypothetical protein
VHAIVEFATHYSGVCQEIVEVAMHENVAIKIYAPVFQKLLKSDHVGPVGRVKQRIPEYFTWGSDFDDLDDVLRQVPPGAFGLKLAVHE